MMMMMMMMVMMMTMMMVMRMMMMMVLIIWGNSTNLASVPKDVVPLFPRPRGSSCPQTDPGGLESLWVGHKSYIIIQLVSIYHLHTL